MKPKTIIYNDDGWSSYMRYPAPMSPEDIVRVTVGPLIGTGVGVYQFCALGGHAVNYNSSFLPRVGEMMDAVDTMHVWRMRETLRNLAKLGTDPLRVVSEACHENGIACQFSLRMNDRHHTYKRTDGSWYFPELLSPWLDEYPELLLPDRALDYAKSGVADYRKRQIREILDDYDVDGIDLDFTRFKPWFRAGDEEDGGPRMTALIRELRTMTRDAGKTLSARFEYDPESCIRSGLDIEAWLADGLLDQITLGGVADHTPDAPADWWIERTHVGGCTIYPGIEGQLHWIPSCGGGGTGLHPGNGVDDGYGPPSLAYMRAVAANHYASGADGISLFNFTCADGPFSRRAFTELADPDELRFGDKQYVAAVWPWDEAIYCGTGWTSAFRVDPGQATASYPLRIADDLEEVRRRNLLPTALLTLDLMGINRLTDVQVTVNGAPLTWNGCHYNHFDHGCWNDIVQFDVPVAALCRGENTIELHRATANPGFASTVEVRKCVLDIAYPRTFAPGRVGHSAVSGQAGN